MRLASERDETAMPTSVPDPRPGGAARPIPEARVGAASGADRVHLALSRGAALFD
ncbi:hypothetical protein GCM10025789_11990 [Tessaracoccus lubricantis]|uniref:Uncharacterized protein n=1 Tax=Tessaracoccus lubricantis TaxID=545543 RepID=A0ABP9FAZ7_9ACTN